ncbi:hypothetical protein SLA2020_462970 [Shorea laevis]
MLGLPKHSDSSLITILQGDAPGLQVLKDEKWLPIDLAPSAFVVNIGNILYFISNGKLNSSKHRVVTHKKVARTTITSIIYPSSSFSIEPTKKLIANASPLYQPFMFRDFVPAHVVDTQDGKCPLDRYKL